MSFQLQMEQMPGYLAASFTGAGTAEEVWRQFELIAEECKRTKNKKLPIDTMGAEGKISLVERFLYGIRVFVVGRLNAKSRMRHAPNPSSRMSHPALFSSGCGFSLARI